MLFNLSPPLEGEAVAKRRQGAVLFAPQKKPPLRLPQGRFYTFENDDFERVG